VLAKQPTVNNTEAHWLKARTAEPEKQPLLVNGSETTFASRQQPRKKRDKEPLLGSHHRANGLAEWWSRGNPHNTNATMVQQQRMLFSTLSMPRSYNRDGQGRPISCNTARFKVLLWRDEFMCDIWYVYSSETVIFTVLKSAARKRLVETVIDWGHYSVCDADL
jgi:hypothetical protein